MVFHPKINLPAINRTHQVWFPSHSATLNFEESGQNGTDTDTLPTAWRLEKFWATLYVQKTPHCLRARCPTPCVSRTTLITLAHLWEVQPMQFVVEGFGWFRGQVSTSRSKHIQPELRVRKSEVVEGFEHNWVRPHQWNAHIHVLCGFRRRRRQRVWLLRVANTSLTSGKYCVADVSCSQLNLTRRSAWVASNHLSSYWTISCVPVPSLRYSAREERDIMHVILMSL